MRLAEPYIPNNIICHTLILDEMEYIRWVRVRNFNFFLLPPPPNTYATTALDSLWISGKNLISLFSYQICSKCDFFCSKMSRIQEILTLKHKFTVRCRRRPHLLFINQQPSQNYACISCTKSVLLSIPKLFANLQPVSRLQDQRGNITNHHDKPRARVMLT